MTLDAIIIGGGILGLATALKLLAAQPGAGVMVLEKEDAVARHQTGRNSGVIHAGIYYAPGSLKAELCRKGAAATKDFCRDNGVPFEVCGKLIVATTPLDVERMDGLAQRAAGNGIAIERIGGSELRALEPNIAGLEALLVPSTGIVDYKAVCAAMARRIEAAGGRIELGVEVSRIVETGNDVTVLAGERRWQAKRLIACAGLQSDRVARLAGLDLGVRIVPFRGEYYRLPAAKNDIVKHLIYPVPDPGLPFLGIHLTRMIGGYVTVGPNAVIAFNREGYGGKLSLSRRDLADFARFGGFWRMVRANLRTGVAEMRNALWRRGYLKECQRYCPSLTLADLLPYPAGIRAQAVKRDGTLLHDFAFGETPRTLHVLNAPSPGATSALPIADIILGKLREQMRSAA